MKVKYHTPFLYWNESAGGHPLLNKNHYPLNLVRKMVRAFSSVDRTGIFNVVDTLYSEIPKVKKWNKTFERCCMDRATQLWSLGKPITLFWSGGIDSSAVLISLIETKNNDDVLNIRYTQNSISEFPVMWEKLVKNIDDPIHDKNVLDKKIFKNHDIIKVTGECGDQCFGSDALHGKLENIDDDWETIFNWDKNKIFGDVDTVYERCEKFCLSEVLFSSVEQAPFDINTVFDLYWWLNFCFKWHDVDTRMIFTFTPSPDWQSTFSFFNNDDFQKWSIVNHDIKHQGSWKTYKQPAKDFINKYVYDENYRVNKTKEPSLIKILEGKANGIYTKTVREAKHHQKDAIRLLLDDGRYWTRYQEIPDEVMNQIVLTEFYDEFPLFKNS